MKKMILSAAIMLASVSASAQHAAGSFTIQPKVGLNIATLTETNNADPRFGVAAGAEFEYQITDMISLSAGAIYSQQGNKYEYNGSNANATLTTKVDYVNVPIMANVYVVPGLAVKFGIQPGFKVNDKVEGQASALGVSGKTSTEGNAESFDFSLPIGLSYEFNNFVLDARYNCGLTKVWENNDPKNSVFQFTLGYKFSL